MASNSAPGAAIFRPVFVPGILAVSIAGWAFRTDIENALTGHAIHTDFITAAFFAMIACIWIAEQVYPANRDWNYRLLSSGITGWSRLIRDLFYLFIVTQLTALAITASSSKVTPFIHKSGLWPAEIPMAARILLAFLIVEFMSYWMHRAAHRYPIFWRFHGTHHVVTELNGFKSLRTHPVDNLFFYLARSTPLLALGVAAPDILAATYFGSVLGILSHANIDVTESGLGLFVNFPRFHRVHHSADVSESNSNFGCHTVVWDRVFGTFRSDAHEPLTLGVEPVAPRSVWHELIRPFYAADP